MGTKSSYKPLRVIISGGGTGGHIFPAVSIAGKLKEVCPGTEILFVGANGKMEMEKVPAAGWKIIGLDIAGIQRKLSLGNIVHNIRVPFLTLKSISRAKRIIKEFKPDIAVGVGGFASAPLLKAAQSLGIPTLIQEQNGFAGLTNRMLGGKAGAICVAYEGMEKFFPAERIVITGNPIRESIRPAKRGDDGRRHLLVIGGSLGARTLNMAMRHWIEEGCPGGDDIDVVWQCGKYYKADTDRFMEEMAQRGIDTGHILHTDFIADMDVQYAKADLVISRSGASSVSELCAAHKACIFVPSPNVAEDHQTHNAMALVSKNAAILVRDTDAAGELLSTAVGLIHDKDRIAELERNIEPLSITDAAQRIVDRIYGLLK